MKKNSYKGHNVYVMRDQSGQVRYVGRTIDPVRRQRQHAKDPRKAGLNPLEVKFSGLSKTEARIMEQLLISSYGINNLMNARREIAVGNVKGFASYLGNTIALIGSFTEDEMLNLMGG